MEAVDRQWIELLRKKLNTKKEAGIIHHPNIRAMDDVFLCYGQRKE